MKRTKQTHNGKATVEYEDELNQFQAYLKQLGLRLTLQRLVIFNEVFSDHGHLDADEITHRLQNQGKKVGRATVYRTLILLVEAGLVKRIRLGSSQQYFEHIHLGEHHDHLVCLSCGKVIEFYSDQIEKYQEIICHKEKFTPHRHTMVIFGVCSECSK